MFPQDKIADRVNLGRDKKPSLGEKPKILCSTNTTMLLLDLWAATQLCLTLKWSQFWGLGVRIIAVDPVTLFSGQQWKNMFVLANVQNLRISFSAEEMNKKVLTVWNRRNSLSQHMRDKHTVRGLEFVSLWCDKLFAFSSVPYSEHFFIHFFYSSWHLEFRVLSANHSEQVLKPKQVIPYYRLRF